MTNDPVWRYCSGSKTFFVCSRLNLSAPTPRDLRLPRQKATPFPGDLANALYLISAIGTLGLGVTPPTGSGLFDPHTETYIADNVPTRKNAVWLAPSVVRLQARDDQFVPASEAPDHRLGSPPLLEPLLNSGPRGAFHRVCVLLGTPGWAGWRSGVLILRSPEICLAIAGRLQGLLNGQSECQFFEFLEFRVALGNRVIGGPRLRHVGPGAVCWGCCSLSVAVNRIQLQGGR